MKTWTRVICSAVNLYLLLTSQWTRTAVQAGRAALLMWLGARIGSP